MSISELIQGERGVAGAVGANAALGGLRAIVNRAHTALEPFMPCLSNLLLLVQIAVGLATLVYMVLKIRKLVKHKKPHETNR